MAHISRCAARTQALDGFATTFRKSVYSTPVIDEQPARCSVGVSGVTPHIRDTYASDRQAENRLEVDLRAARMVSRMIGFNLRLTNPWPVEDSTCETAP